MDAIQRGMPALSADWPEVKATAIAIGNLKDAAAKHGVSYEATRQRAAREKWPVGQRVHTLAREAKAASHAVILKTANVTRVTSASEALGDTVTDNQSRYTTAMSHVLADKAEAYKAAPLLAKPRDLNDLASAGAKVFATGGSGEGGTVAIQINIG